jgi:D-apionolactonase
MTPILCQDRLPAQRRVLRAGPVTVEYDEGGDLRYVRVGGELALLRVYAAVRDRNWGTIAGVIRDEAIEVGEREFLIRYVSRHTRAEIDFEWRAEIRGTPEGQVTFRFDGECLSDFERNRIGFCLLQPQEFGGLSCSVEYTDGRRAEAVLPRDVCGQQPVPGFTDLREITQTLPAGGSLVVRMEGDAFEMEDQRNWIDASFKTFCTPLSLPYPVRVTKGSRVSQCLTLVGKAGVCTGTMADETRVVVAESGRRHALPEIGFGCSTSGRTLAPFAAEALHLLNPRHLRVDLGWNLPELQGVWARALREARDIEAKVEVALHVDPTDPSLAQLLNAVEQERALLARVLVLSRGTSATTDAAFKAVVERLRVLGVPLVTGTNADFYHLTRAGMPPWQRSDAVCWAMNPQVHAFDWTSISETPSVVPAQLHTAARWFPGRQLIVSPITLRPRYLPDAKGLVAPTPAGELPFSVDPRQPSLVAAGWTLAMLARLAQGGARSVTLFETHGWRGLVEDAEGSPVPEKFHSHPGRLFPLYHALALLAAHASGSIRFLDTSRPFELCAIELSPGTHVLANLSPGALAVSVPAWKSRPVSIIRLHAGNVSEAAAEPRWFADTARLEPCPAWSRGYGELSGGELLLARVS